MKVFLRMVALFTVIIAGCVFFLSGNNPEIADTSAKVGICAGLMWLTTWNFGKN